MKNESVEIMVLGASARPGRYSNLAVKRLIDKGYKVISIGKTGGNICENPVLSVVPSDARPQTVLMYLSPKNQNEYLDVIIKLKPRFVIFSPGTENPEFEHVLRANGIHVKEHCDLIMMSMNIL